MQDNNNNNNKRILRRRRRRRRGWRGRAAVSIEDRNMKQMMMLLRGAMPWECDSVSNFFWR
jgi:hypothetical protein